VIVYAVVDDALSFDFPLGDAVETFVRREDAERFIAEVRGDDPEAAAKLRIEERELLCRSVTPLNERPDQDHKRPDAYSADARECESRCQVHSDLGPVSTARHGHHRPFGKHIAEEFLAHRARRVPGDRLHSNAMRLESPIRARDEEESPDRREARRTGCSSGHAGNGYSGHTQRRGVVCRSGSCF
jgi:hypothetical protein